MRALWNTAAAAYDICHFKFLLGKPYFLVTNIRAIHELAEAAIRDDVGSDAHFTFSIPGPCR